MSEAVIEKETQKQEEVITLNATAVKADENTITKESAVEDGWSDAEVKSAEDRGMFKVEEDPEKKKEEPKKEPENKEPEKKEPEKKEEPKPAGKRDYALSPEEETKLAESFGPGTNVSGLYHGMKAQRGRAQVAERERDDTIIKLRMQEKENSSMKDRLDKIESKTLGIEDDNDGVDPDDKPLTMRQLKVVQEKNAKETAELRKDQDAANAKLSEEANSFSEYGKAEYKDFDKMVEISEKIMTGKIVLGEKSMRKAKKLVSDLKAMARGEIKVTIDDYNPADVAYELGQLGLEESGEENKNGDNADKARLNGERTTGTTSPDITNRIEKNTSRRTSSASLSGSGGARIVSPEDVTLEDINVMTHRQRGEFKQKHPDRYRSLLRG